LKRFDSLNVPSLCVLITLIIAGCVKIQRPSLDAESHIYRGHHNFLNGNYDEAISDYNRAIELNPEFSEAYYTRGSAYDRKGQYNHAIDDYTKAIELNPYFVEAYSNRGVANGIIGRYDRSISDLKKAIEIRPNFADSYYNRGSAYDSERGDLDNCSRIFRLISYVGFNV
jgi:tetratricopeptide (TPR) repeat protein